MYYYQFFNVQIAFIQGINYRIVIQDFSHWIKIYLTNKYIINHNLLLITVIMIYHIS